jgi:spore germination protein KB
MPKETITKAQGICIVITFLTGNLIMANLNPEAGQDTWISLIMAAVGFIPLLLVYSRIIRLCPEKDIFQIIEALFGRVTAKALTALLLWYSIHLFSIVTRSFAEFIEISSMPETPQLPVMIIMMLLAAYIAKSGAESFGKWSVVAFLLITLSILFTAGFSINRMDLTNIQPVLSHNAGALLMGAFSLLAFPFAETVLFLGIANTLKKTDSPRRIYFWGAAAGMVLMLIVIIRNIGVTGVPMMKAAYFPSYVTARIINISDVISRIEGMVSMNYILSGLAKATLCLLVAAKGAASLFGAGDYRKMVMPVGCFGLALSAVVSKNAMEVFSFLKVYPYYAVPFQTGIPLIVWIAAEVRARKAAKA